MSGAASKKRVALTAAIAVVVVGVFAAVAASSRNSSHAASESPTPTTAASDAAGGLDPSSFDVKACSLVTQATAGHVIGQSVTAAQSTDGSNTCEYRKGTRVVVTIEIDRGLNGGAANATDLNRLVSGTSGHHAEVPKIGDRAVLLGNKQSSVLYVLAKGWTLQVVAASEAAERQLARSAVTRL